MADAGRGRVAKMKTDIEPLKTATKTEIENHTMAIKGEFKALKSDIVYLKETAATKTDIACLKETVATKADVAQSATRIIRWIIGTRIALAVVLIVYLEFIFPGTN
ncbi:MAG: hypothetical protein OXC62_15420 [Aestuariivita sp.]|nr:hypothetical protein [Aestuariivita sp.]